MVVEVINTGTELLLGNVTNTHLGFLARELQPFGLRISRQATVPDGEAIRDALQAAIPRTDILFITGGLGPTTDDITRDIVSDLLSLKMEDDAEVLQAIEFRFANHGLQTTKRVFRQAQKPLGATVLPNANGTAPGLYIAPVPEKKSPHLFLLPGPPRELHPMFEEHVKPILQKIVPGYQPLHYRTFKIAGLAESLVEDRVGPLLLTLPDMELGYCARPGEVDIRCIGVEESIETAEKIIREHLKENLVSTDGRSLEQVVVDALTDSGQTLAVAESCTGGLLSNRITNVPGASRIFKEGAITYANEAKVKTLHIDPKLIATHGAVSHQVASSMAKNAVHYLESDYALSLTGIAGPGGGSPEKPVGTVYIGFAKKNAVPIVEKHHFPSDRENFKFLASQAALDLLRRHLENK